MICCAYYISPEHGTSLTKHIQHSSSARLGHSLMHSELSFSMELATLNKTSTHGYVTLPRCHSLADASPLSQNMFHLARGGSKQAGTRTRTRTRTGEKKNSAEFLFLPSSMSSRLLFDVIRSVDIGILQFFSLFFFFSFASFRLETWE